MFAKTPIIANKISPLFSPRAIRVAPRPQRQAGSQIDRAGDHAPAIMRARAGAEKSALFGGFSHL